MRNTSSLRPADHGTTPSPDSGAAHGILIALPISIAMWAALLLGVYLIA